MVAHTFRSSTQKAEEGGSLEFKASLVYTASVRPAERPRLSEYLQVIMKGMPPVLFVALLSVLRKSPGPRQALYPRATLWPHVTGTLTHAKTQMSLEQGLDKS